MLAADVWPALVDRITQEVIGVAPLPIQVNPRNVNPDNQQPTTQKPMPAVALRGLSEGEQLSVPESPWAWLMNDTGAMPSEIGSDKSLTKWTFMLRLLMEWENDPTNAERILMPIIEQVRMVFQRHLKLGTTTVVMSMVRATTWGYTPVNTLWYRTCDIQIGVDEKEIRNFQA